MGIFKFLGGSGNPQPAKTHTLIAIEWDKIHKHVDDLSFIGEYQNPVIWVFSKFRNDQPKISKLLNNRPFALKEQPSYERKLGMFLVNAVAFELLTNERYKKVIVITGDDFMDSTVTFWKSVGLEADLRVFEANQANRRSDRAADRLERPNDRQSRQQPDARQDRRQQPERREREPQTRDERRPNHRAEGLPERGPRQDRAERPNRLDRQEGPERPDNRRQPPQQHQAPQADDAMLLEILRLNPQPIAEAVARAIAENFELGQNYTISRMAQVVKDASGMPISVIFGYRGNRIMLDRMVQSQFAASEDERNFTLLAHPGFDFVMSLIAIRSEYRPEKRGRGRFQRGQRGPRPTTQDAQPHLGPEQQPTAPQAPHHDTE